MPCYFVVTTCEAVLKISCKCGVAEVISKVSQLVLAWQKTSHANIYANAASKSISYLLRLILTWRETSCHNILWQCGVAEVVCTIFQLVLSWHEASYSNTL